MTVTELAMVGQYFKVSLDHLIMGLIDYWQVAESFGNDTFIPSRFRLFPFSKMRDPLPAFLEVVDTRSNAEIKSLLKNFGLELEMLKSAEQRIGVYFKLDLFKLMIRNGHFSKSLLAQIEQRTSNQMVQGLMNSTLKNQPSPQGILQSWITHHDEYESHFLPKIVETRKNKIVLTLTPNQHMQEVDYLPIGKSICEYKLAYIKGLLSISANTNSEIKESDCHFEGNHACTYHLQWKAS